MPGAHILVVDDDRDTRELYRLLFELEGYRVSEADSVAGGVRLGKLERPDLILTDWRLPDGEALALCEVLHRHGRTRRIPIVVATGMSLSAPAIAQARSLGCREVLIKPVDVDALLTTANRTQDAPRARRLRAAALRVERFITRVRRNETVPAAADDAGMASMMIAHESRHARPGVALIVADDHGHYVAANDDAASLTGYGTQELTRLSVWDITPVPADVDVQELWTRFIHSGNQEGQYDLRRRDGARVRTQYVAIANITPGLHLSALSAVVSSPASAHS